MAASNPQDHELVVATNGGPFALEESAIDAFVEGSFQRALKLANESLEHLATTSPQQSSWDNDHAECIVLQTCLKLNDSTNYRFMLQRKSLGPDPIDRLAAVILQSWYEISKQASSDLDLRQGQAHLETFFKTYSSRPCSLELMLVLIQFLRATDRSHEAIELASETLFHVFAEHNESMFFFLKEELREVVRELLVFLFQNMPYSIHETMIENGLRRFSQPTWKAFGTGINEQWTLSTVTAPSSPTISACISFLDNPPLHWPDECKDLMEDCRGSLEEMQRLDLQQSESLSSSSSDSAESHQLSMPMKGSREASGAYAILPTLGFDGSLRQWLRHAVHVVRVMLVDPVMVSEQRLLNRTKVALSIWTLYVAWRRRRRVKLVLSEAVWKPMQEILDAVVPK
ncbi:hypothetical protein MPSEU_000561900 [Mayamaea pseudoterrestris]|nr:hypothetical protein MPSEU_000561900 [Mayamaea pseudoterrestris]